MQPTFQVLRNWILDSKVCHHPLIKNSAFEMLDFKSAHCAACTRCKNFSS